MPGSCAASGRNGRKSLFAAGEEPAAFLASTLHTLELAAPAAGTWSLPLTLYAAPPGGEKKAFVVTLNQRTQQAAADLMSNPVWQGKTVVMVWEHDHIADAKLEKKFPGEAVTLRQLLGLDTMKGVPDTWPAGNYDYFWIVDFDQGAGTPTDFRMVKKCSMALSPTCRPTTGARRTGSQPIANAILRARTERPHTRLSPISSEEAAPSSGETGLSRWRPLPSGLSDRKRS